MVVPLNIPFVDGVIKTDGEMELTYKVRMMWFYSTHDVTGEGKQRVRDVQIVLLTS